MCQHIAYLEGGAPCILGFISGITKSSFPSPIPKCVLAVEIEFAAPEDEGVYPVSVTVITPKQEQFVVFENQLELSKQGLAGHGRWFHGVELENSVMIEEPGTYAFEFRIGEHTTAFETIEFSQV